MKTRVFIAFLLSFLILHPLVTSAQSTTKPSVCEYQETRNPVPINPKTNKTYTPDERKKEPFNNERSKTIDIAELTLCLKAGKTIGYHHVVFEDLVMAWKQAITLKAQDALRDKGIDRPTTEQIEQEKKWDLPIMLDSGVLHANTPYNDAGTPWVTDDTGGIRFGEFRDPTVKNSSKLTEEERKTLGIAKTGELIALIHSRIEWKKVLINSEVLVVSIESESIRPSEDIIPIIFRDIVYFSSSNFNEEAYPQRLAPAPYLWRAVRDTPADVTGPPNGGAG